MSRWIALVAVAALLPAPALAGPLAKKPTCQTSKAPSRETTKKPEPCRRNAPIPWVVDPTPYFLASAIPWSATVADIN